MKGRGIEWDARKSKQEQKAMRDMEELTCKEEVRNRVEDLIASKYMWDSKERNARVATKSRRVRTTGKKGVETNHRGKQPYGRVAVKGRCTRALKNVTRELAQVKQNKYRRETKK